MNKANEEATDCLNQLKARQQSIFGFKFNEKLLEFEPQEVYPKVFGALKYRNLVSYNKNKRSL